MKGKIKMENKDKMCVHIEERREFLKSAGALLGAGLAFTSFSSLLCSCENDQYIFNPPPPPTSIDIDLSKYPNLGADGGAVIDNFSYTVEGKTYTLRLAIARKSSTEYIIVAANCTHQGVPLNLGEPLVCPLHSAKFNLAKDPPGKVAETAGQKVTDLKTYESKVKGGTLIIYV
ncbi:MAG: Rieske protein [Ignavibacteria bacterium]|nr:Rieske protein [Ignavibacteria bacterium]